MSNLHCQKFLVILLISVVGVLGFTSMGFSQEINRKDPVAVANTFLKSLHDSDYQTIIQLMSENQRKEYQTIMSNNPKDIEKIFSKDKKKAGKTTEVSELRKMTTFSGKPGIAAKVRKKGPEIFIIILAQEGENYFYENSLTVTAKLYHQLTLIQKVK
jgi:hypothetical protein